MGQNTNTPSLENSIRQEGDDFIFNDVPYAGTVIPEVRLLGNLMDDGSRKTQMEWRVHNLEYPEKGINMTIEMAYQLVRKLYALRDVRDFAVQQKRDSCLALLRGDSGPSMHTGTRILYKRDCLDAMITHFELEGEGKKRTIPVEIPDFPSPHGDYLSYLLLAKKQQENALGTVEIIPANARPVLEALHGEGYEEAGAVWQFFSPKRYDGDLREVRLGTPTIRERDTSRAGLLFINSIDHSFYVSANCDSKDHKSARGWVDNSKMERSERAT